MIKRKIVPVACLCVVIIICMYCFAPNNNQRLVKAIEKEDISTVEKLLASGVDPNQPDIKKEYWALWSFLEVSPRMPLSVACGTGNLDMVELLIEYGAEAGYVEHTGWSPLRETLFWYDPNDVQIVQILLNHGADGYFIEGELPVFVAARMRPQIYDREKTNGTIFLGEYDEETAQGITEIVKLLIGDISINATTSMGESLLILVVQQENVFLVKYLISVECDIHIKDAKGNTALFYAQQSGNVELIGLIKNGMDSLS